MVNSATILKLGNPIAPWNPFAPVDWLVNQIDSLTGHLLTWLGLFLVWLLSCLPPGFGYFGYIVFAIWLTWWVSRHIPMIPLNPQSPMFSQPGGGRLWVRLGMFDLLLAVGGAGIGAYIPDQLADTIWRNPYAPFADTLGPMGRIAELVGLVCGFRIAMHCRYQLNLLMFVGLMGYFGIRVAAWVLGG
jgi:hypothetical protein